MSGRGLKEAGIAVDGLLEAGEAALLQAAEVEEDASGLGDGEQGDDNGLELLGAGAGAESIEVTPGGASAGAAAAPRSLVAGGWYGMAALPRWVVGAIVWDGGESAKPQVAQ